jgi:hypothetical protein
MMIGGYIWGSLGDSLGRRVVLLNAMLGNKSRGTNLNKKIHMKAFISTGRPHERHARQGINLVDKVF